jgi:hypothetical protein
LVETEFLWGRNPNSRDNKVDGETVTISEAGPAQFASYFAGPKIRATLGWWAVRHTMGIILPVKHSLNKG